MTVRELSERVTHAEYIGWWAYHLHHPLHDRGDLHAGIVASTIANVYSSKQYAPADFMPGGWKPRQTPAEMSQVFRTYVAAHNRGVK